MRVCVCGRGQVERAELGVRTGLETCLLSAPCQLGVLSSLIYKSRDGGGGDDGSVDGDVHDGNRGIAGSGDVDGGDDNGCIL